MSFWLTSHADLRGEQTIITLVMSIFMRNKILHVWLSITDHNTPAGETIRPDRRHVADGVYDDFPVTASIAVEILISSSNFFLFFNYIIHFTYSYVSVHTILTTTRVRMLCQSEGKFSRNYRATEFNTDLPGWWRRKRSLLAIRIPRRTTRSNVHYERIIKRGVKIKFLLVDPPSRYNNVESFKCTKHF